jgi:hypothetical protein
VSERLLHRVLHLAHGRYEALLQIFKGFVALVDELAELLLGRGQLFLQVPDEPRVLLFATCFGLSRVTTGLTDLLGDPLQLALNFFFGPMWRA